MRVIYLYLRCRCKKNLVEFIEERSIKMDVLFLLLVGVTLGWLVYIIERGDTMKVSLERAIEIVLELARDNICDDPEVNAEQEQNEACNVVEDFFVDHVW